MTENKPLDPAGALASFYRETILQHTSNPVGFRAPIAATHSSELYNPFCGDRVRLQFALNGNIIEAASFDGESCGICMASASILCDCSPGERVSAVKARHDWLESALKSDGDHAREGTVPGALEALLGVRRYPTRINCAMLPWQAALKALGL